MYGLNPNTLRTWERRYYFPSPARSAGGHRAYSPADIALISIIMDLIAGGLSPAEAVDQARKAKPRAGAAQRHSPPAPQSAVTRSILKAIYAHDQAKIRSLTEDAIRRLGYQAFIEAHAFPLLAQLGHTWERTSHGIADEHSFTMVVQGAILQHAQKIETDKKSPTVTFACAPGEVHQLALLHLANITAQQKIARPLILAAGLPIEETLTASRAASSKLIVMSSTTKPPSGDTRRWVSACVDAGWANRIVLAGPGFVRSRVYTDFPVMAAPGNFDQTAHLVKRLTTPTS
jgi:DNA-binding transcriptional MerR regulator